MVTDWAKKVHTPDQIYNSWKTTVPKDAVTLRNPKKVSILEMDSGENRLTEDHIFCIKMDWIYDTTIFEILSTN